MAKVVDQEKKQEQEFLKTLKLLFSSLTARGISTAYFNVAPDTIILANSSSNNSLDDHGDRLMDYSVGELSMHFLEIKDREFVTKLREIAKIPDGVYYALQVLNLISLLGKHRPGEMCIFDNEEGCQVMQVKTRSTYEKKNIIGFPVKNFHVIRELYQWYHHVSNIGSTEHKSKYPNLTVQMDRDPTITGRVFFMDIDPNRFISPEGISVFRDVSSSMKVLCLDGLTTVSIREFIKKLKDDFTLDLYMWVVDSSYVLSMSMFEDNVVKVRSIRPNVLSVPIPATIVKETENLFTLTEEDLSNG